MIQKTASALVISIWYISKFPALLLSALVLVDIDYLDEVGGGLPYASCCARTVLAGCIE